MQQPIIDPIPTQLIEAELTADKFLRHTNKGDNEIYVVDSFSAPNTMRELGRLREEAFRESGEAPARSVTLTNSTRWSPPVSNCSYGIP